MRRIALIPNAKNPIAEEIRNRTRCAICKERIETGQEIDIDEKGIQRHVKCLEKGGEQ